MALLFKEVGNMSLSFEFLEGYLRFVVDLGEDVSVLKRSMLNRVLPACSKRRAHLKVP